MKIISSSCCTADARSITNKFYEANQLWLDKGTLPFAEQINMNFRNACINAKLNSSCFCLKNNVVFTQIYFNFKMSKLMRYSFQYDYVQFRLAL